MLRAAGWHVQSEVAVEDRGDVRVSTLLDGTAVTLIDGHCAIGVRTCLPGALPQTPGFAEA